MNRWLYRAAGTVGIAGGFLALGAGTAQADQTGPEEALGTPELLLGGQSPLGQPASPLNLLLFPLPVGDPGSAIGAALPPLNELIRYDGDLVGLPTGAATGPVTTALAAPIPAPAPVPAAAPTPEIVGSLPFLTGPLTDSLLGGRSLSELVMVGDLAGQVPVAGPVVSQTVGTLPLVGDVVPSTHRAGVPGARTLPADPSLPSLPPAADQLPPVIADQLASEGRFSPELLGTAGPGRAEFTDALPLIGPALRPIGHMIGVGNLAGQLPLVGPLAGSALGSLPVVADPAPPAAPMAVDQAGPDGERPVAGDDPEFAESAEVLPVGPAGGLTQQLPVALPLEALPLDTLPLDALRGLPIVGVLAGGLPL